MVECSEFTLISPAVAHPLITPADVGAVFIIH